MKISTSELPPRQVVLDIEVEPDRVDRAMEQAYRRLSQRINVPGFRKGKAPRTLVERMVGRQAILEDALEHLAPDVVNEAIKQEQLTPYTRPQVELVEVEPLRVKATVPLEPRVELGAYQSELQVAVETMEVAAAQIDAVIDRLRESYAQWVPVERPVRAGDRVGIDVKGEVVESERVLLDSKDAEYVVDPDGPQPAPGFADELVEMEAGTEKTFTLTLPEDYRETALAGAPVRFSVRLHWVKEKQLPEVDDEFAQQVGEYADAQALRSAVETQLREREEERIRQEAVDASLDKLVEISTIEVAPQLVELQTDSMLETFSQNVERQGLKLDQYLRFAGKDLETLRGEVRVEAEKRVKRALAVEAFTTAEAVTVEPAEVDAEIRRAAAETANPGQAESAALSDATTRTRVEGVIRERKALTRLVKLATGKDLLETTPPPDGSETDPDEKISQTDAATPDTQAESEEVVPAAVSGEPPKER